MGKAPVISRVSSCVPEKSSSFQAILRFDLNMNSNISHQLLPRSNDLSFHIHFIDLCFYCISTIISCCLFVFLQRLGISEETSETKFIYNLSINEISVMSFLDMLYSDRTIQILWVVTNLLYRQKTTIVINLGPAIFLPQISPNSAAKLQRAPSHPVLSALRKSMIHFTSLQSSCELQWIRRV